MENDDKWGIALGLAVRGIVILSVFTAGCFGLIRLAESKLSEDQIRRFEGGTPAERQAAPCLRISDAYGRDLCLLGPIRVADGAELERFCRMLSDRRPILECLVPGEPKD